MSQTALTKLLDTFRQVAQTEREKGTYFEELVKTYLLTEPSYKDLFKGKVYLWEEWRRQWMSQGNADPGADAGIDLVAVEDLPESPRVFAIQAKFYAEDAKIGKGDGIDSFLSAMGKKPFTNGLLFLTSYQASHHVNALIQGRDKPINIIDLFALEESQIDWAQYQPKAAPALKPRKQLREHQQSALTAVEQGFAQAERGKLIMACGTGKTFTALKIAERVAGAGGRVLFLVPSLNLLSQTLTEWTQESATPLHSFAVCSDAEVGKKRGKDDDTVQTLVHELRYPATTNPARLAAEMGKRHDAAHMSVVFSTYHSIDTIAQAQQQHGLAGFDLIICDEAHRTTGATFGDEDESAFVKVHDGAFIRSAKRLYMTATPRIYGDHAKASAEKDNVALCSMDDETLYGKELYVITFSEAVKRGLLCDYKVLVLSVQESHVSRRLQNLLKDESNQLKVDDAAKIIGCWKALSKQGISDELVGDSAAMKRAVAFCQVIEAKQGGKVTVTDAARHLSIAFGEDVTEADVLRLALDGRLRLSVYFVNHAKARCGKVVTWDETDWWLFPDSDDFPGGRVMKRGGQTTTDKCRPCPQKLEALFNEIPEAERGNYYPMMHELNIDGERFLKLVDEVTTLRGVWDLPMIGNERLDIEHEYQKLTGGPAVTLQGLDGAFVEGRDGQICQLQESYDENEYQPGSSAHLERLQQHIAEKGIESEEAESLLNRHKEQRKGFLEEQRTRPAKENYYPAGGLPEDAVIVVRTEALREFERHSNDAPLPTSRPHVSDKLAKMSHASTKFWSNADRDDRGTHPDNARVAAWLVQQGFSPTLADKAATIIRPEWAPTGRKPEE